MAAQQTPCNEGTNINTPPDVGLGAFESDLMHKKVTGVLNELASRDDSVHVTCAVFALIHNWQEKWQFKHEQICPFRHDPPSCTGNCSENFLSRPHFQESHYLHTVFCESKIMNRLQSKEEGKKKQTYGSINHQKLTLTWVKLPRNLLWKKEKNYEVL